MSYVEPRHSKSQVNKAGEIIKASDQFTAFEQLWANTVLSNWRAAHGYPINTFQATLRQKLVSIDPKAIVAQRLKRQPSIISKLRRFNGMRLARMQDIGGLRAVVGSVAKVRKLEKAYRTAKFQHSLDASKDYLAAPKADGYRGLHLIYKYKSEVAPKYNGLALELRIRTRLQHAWATAVETMGTFLGQALKSGQGEKKWKEFFKVASAAIAIIEKSNPVAGFEGLSAKEVFKKVAQAERDLHVLEKLRGFAIATNKITTERGQGAYHLIVLDSVKRSVSIRPYAVSRLEQANNDYAEIEMRAKNGEPIEAVLVSAGPVDSLRKAYPNYFLDTEEFIRQIEKITAKAK